MLDKHSYSSTRPLVAHSMLKYSSYMAKTSYSGLLKKALEAGSHRDYVEAETILTKIVSETEDMPEAWLFLGRTRHALGQYDRALAAFGSFLGLKAHEATGWFFMGRSYLATGSAREAVSCLRTAIEKGRNGADTWTLLGFAELRLKKSGKAVASLEHAVSLAPKDVRIFRAYLNALYVHAIRTLARGNAHEAAGMFAFVIGNGFDGPAQRLYRVRALRTEGRLEEAITDINAAIQMRLEDPSLHLQAAALLFATGNIEEAMMQIHDSGMVLPEQKGAPWTAEAIERWRILEALKQGDYKTALKSAIDRIRSGEKDAAIRAVAAQANYELHHFSRAVEHYRRAIEADPGSPDLRMGLALSLWETGDYTGSRNASKAAAARGAPRDETLYIETICEARLGGEPSRLLPQTQALLRSRPGDPRLMMLLGECLYRTARPDLADAWFNDVLVVWPQHELSMLYRISVSESLANDRQAVQRYAEYVAAYPDNSKIRKEYIELLIRLADWKTAATVMEEGYAYGSKGSDGMLALCYRNSGRYREAASLYRTLLRADPKRVDLLLGLSYSLYKSGAKSLATELLSRGAEFIKVEAEPFLALGVMKVRQNEPEKAAAAFLKASELAPADPRPLRNLAKLYAKAGIAETAMHFEDRATALESGSSRHKKP